MYKLKELRDETDEAIKKAQQLRGELDDEPINWADLSCYSAEYAIDDEGEGYYRVYIEEAGPSCPKFHAFIAERLCEAGFQNVEVITEW